MNYILYYSNFCQHSKQLLIILAKQKVAIDEISYICIDKRQQMDDGTVFAELDNGNNILEHFKKTNKQQMLEDPSAFSFSEMSGASDKYSYLDMSTDELSAKGSGGLRMMHDYVSLENDQRIETPPEEEAITNDVSMEQIMKQREGEINLNR